MKLTVLGNNGPFPAAGGACSGYLLEDGPTKILLDCGNGVLSNLQRAAGFENLDAIILSHLHSDHVSDMMVLRYAVQIKNKRGSMNRLLNVYAPQEPVEEYERLNIEDAFVLKPLSEGMVLEMGRMKISFSEMKHPVKSFGISVECGKKRFVYSGDTSWNDNIIAFSKGSDLLMLDAGLLTRDKTGDNVPHLTAGECGLIAAQAGARRLLLTHLWPEYDVKELIAEAKENFGSVEAAELMGVYQI